MIEGVFSHFIVRFLYYVSRERLWKIRLLPCKFVTPSKDIRVSFSALLRLAEGDSYLLVRSLHRRDAFGPFGGVYKYHDTARSHLDDLDFRPQRGTAVDDMKNDLRGFLPRRRVLALMRWFDHGTEREDAGICLRRELIEELKEVGLAERHPVPKRIQFKHIRRVQEGPTRAAGQTYTQYRIFDIYDIATPDDEISQFLHDLRLTAATHEHLMVVTARQIISGRSDDGSTIGHHAGYLFGRKRVRPDEPMFVEPH